MNTGDVNTTQVGGGEKIKDTLVRGRTLKFRFNEDLNMNCCAKRGVRGWSRSGSLVVSGITIDKVLDKKNR